VKSILPWTELLRAASRVRENAYAPYSGYRVGAAILTANGSIVVGCNVENASFGLTVCAERNAIGQMVASGERAMSAIVIVTEGPEPGTPCGACRQALAELASDLAVGLAVAGEDAPRTITSLAELFPRPFLADLGRASK
jgi:cytidine deaminase